MCSPVVPDDPGIIRALRGTFIKAAETYAEALILRPNEENVLFHLGNVQMLLDRQVRSCIRLALFDLIVVSL